MILEKTSLGCILFAKLDPKVSLEISSLDRGLPLHLYGGVGTTLA